MANIPGPATCMAKILGFGQIGLATSQLPLRFHCYRNIRDRPKKLDAAGSILRHTSHGADIFHRAVRHQQSKFVIIVLSIDGDTLDGSWKAARSSGCVRWTIDSMLGFVARSHPNIRKVWSDQMI